MSTTDMGVPVPAVHSGARQRRGGFLEDYFYFAMALVIPAIVVFGFSFTIDRNLIHPAIPRPSILYVHAAVFSGWLLFFCCSLCWCGPKTSGCTVRSGGLERCPGRRFRWWAMARFHIEQLHEQRFESFLIIPLWEMVLFTSAFRAGDLLAQEPRVPPP